MLKLRKQAAAKAAIVTLTAALLAAFYGVIHANPRINADDAPQAQPPVDYDRFFAPGTAPQSQPGPVIPPIRTRAS